MKSIAIFLLLTVAVKADFILDIGTNIADTYIGLCQGLQDDYTITDSVCVSSCSTAYDYIIIAFDKT